jgi:hypothetical protein
VKAEIVQRRTDEGSTWLLQHGANVTSQCGEDGILAKIFEVIGEHGKLCVEFGAWDGREFSNTYALIQQQGWSGYLIEANPERFKALQETYGANPRAKPINRFVRLDKGEGTIDEILAEHGCPAEIDLLSIDIDGNDYYVWESMAEPSAKVVVIEFNPTVPNDVYFVQDRSFQVNQGCSLLALIQLGREQGYELVCATGWNAIFVRLEYFALFNIEDNSIDAMYQPLMNGRIFHGFDGTVHVLGMPRLMWHNMRFGAETFQVLPPEKRVHGDAQR